MRIPLISRKHTSLMRGVPSRKGPVEVLLRHESGSLIWEVFDYDSRKKLGEVYKSAAYRGYSHTRSEPLHYVRTLTEAVADLLLAREEPPEAPRG